MRKILTAVTALVRPEPAHAVYCDVIDRKTCNIIGCKFKYQCWYSPGQHAYTYWGSCQNFVIC